MKTDFQQGGGMFQSVQSVNLSQKSQMRLFSIAMNKSYLKTVLKSYCDKGHRVE